MIEKLVPPTRKPLKAVHALLALGVALAGLAAFAPAASAACLQTSPAGGVASAQIGCNDHVDVLAQQAYPSGSSDDAPRACAIINPLQAGLVYAQVGCGGLIDWVYVAGHQVYPLP